MAILATIVSMGFGNKSAKPDDFMPKFEPPKGQSIEDMKRTMKNFVRRYNSQRRK